MAWKVDIKGSLCHGDGGHSLQEKNLTSMSVQKVLEEKGTNPRSYEKYLKTKCGHDLFNVH